MPSKSNLKLVSFDDGGIRGFSQLEIMSNIMHRLDWSDESEESDEHKLPCECFDMIGGCGTGGLIAILLGKLRMSMEEASDTFCTIVEQAYVPDNLSASERTKVLRGCMEDALKSKGLPIDLQLMEKQQVGCPCSKPSNKRKEYSLPQNLPRPKSAPIHNHDHRCCACDLCGSAGLRFHTLWIGP